VAALPPATGWLDHDKNPVVGDVIINYRYARDSPVDDDGVIALEVFFKNSLHHLSIFFFQMHFFLSRTNDKNCFISGHVPVG
jgi:hypothetical protein